MILSLELQELWAIHQFLRRTSAEDHGAEWDQDFMLNVYEGILECERDPRKEWVLICAENDLWQITRQVPLGYVVGTEYVGKKLLLKTIAALVMAEKERRQSDELDASQDPNHITYNSTTSQVEP